MVPDAISLDRGTFTTIRTNLAWAFSCNVAASPLAAAEFLNPTASPVLHVHPRLRRDARQHAHGNPAPVAVGVFWAARVSAHQRTPRKVSLPGHNVIMSGWVGRSAGEIAAAVRSGEATARAVVSEHLDRIAGLNPELGAFVRVRSAEAMREAEEVDGRADRQHLRLAGVPVAIKDNVPVGGEPMRLGSGAAPQAPQAGDHPVVARLRAAGAVVVGLTNLPELAIYPFTDSVFGIARNPWDRRRAAGGSSGGSAAAVASGMVPLAHGNDGLGSIRIPAAACGLFGIKPGAGVVPALIGADSWRGMSENGPLATTVADAALMLEAMAGTSFDLAEPPALRIAVSVKPTGPGVMVHRRLAAAVRQCGERLATMGHTVEAGDPPYPLWSTPAAIARWFACTVADAKQCLAGSGWKAAPAGMSARAR